jgi:Recombinase
MLPMRAFASHSGKYDSRAMNIGYIVDRDKHSPTYKRYIVLPKHADIVNEKIFLRLIDYGGDSFALMHELEKEVGVHFPWHDDPLFNNKVELLKIPGVGYRIGTYNTLLHILRNPVYIGTWKTGNKEYPNNHEAIVTMQTWDTVQYLLDKRQENIYPHPRNKSYDTLLKGLIIRPFSGCIVSVSPHNGEISLAWKDSENRMHPNRRDIIPLATVETMFQDIFTRRILLDDKCYEYAKAASSLYEAETKNKEHIQTTIIGLEAQRRAILDDLENPKMRARMSERTVEEKYKKVAEREGEIARLTAVLNRPSKYIPLPDLLTLIEQLRENWDSLSPATIRNVALVFCKGILLTPRSNHIWSFDVQWELWPSDTGIFWLNVGDKYHWFDEDIAMLKTLADCEAQLEEVLHALPKFSQTAISNMSLRKCGRRIVPKGNHRLDAYMTREDMSVLEEYGVGIEPIANMRGAMKAREFNGSEYWSLAYTKRKECHDTIFFVDRDDGTNQEGIK